jgi:hypothetical protein
MPIARSQGHAGRALLIAAAGALLTLAVAFGISVLDNRGQVDVRLGDDTFSGLQADQMADDIADRGPLLIPDASPGGDRDIVLQHLGADDDEGWIAIDGREFPADGAGLETFPVTVFDGKLDVDINAANR